MRARPRRLAALPVVLVLLLSAPAVAPAALAAQEEPQGQDAAPRQDPPQAPADPLPAARFLISLTAGSRSFGTLQTQTVLAERVTFAGTPTDSALLRRTVEWDGGLQMLASVGVRVGAMWSVRVGAGYGRMTFRPTYTAAETEVDTVWLITAQSLARREATGGFVATAEGAVRRWVDTPRRFRPYVELGAAVLWFETERPSVDGLPTRIAAFGAAGGQVPITGRLSARLQASARAFRTPVGAAPEGFPGAAINTLQTTFRDPQDLRSGDESRELVTSVRLELGLTLGLGSPSPAARPAPADSPSAPPRGARP